MRTLSLFARWLSSPSMAGAALVAATCIVCGAVLAMALPWGLLRWFTLPGFVLALAWVLCAGWRACRRPVSRRR